jgi:hypothetical protein
VLQYFLMDEQQKKQQPKGSGLSEPIIITPQDPAALKISHEDSQPVAQPAQIAKVPTIQQTQPEPPVAPTPSSPLTALPEQQPVNQPAPEQSPPNWQYQSGKLDPTVGYDNPAKANVNQTPDSQLPTAGEPSIKWSASEFVSHEKSAGWYVILAVGVVLLAAIIFLITKDIFSTVVVCLIAIILGVFGALKPRVLDYAISASGIQVGTKQFAYDAFKSFSVLDDSALPSIQLLPQKRFMMPITMYFAPNDKEKIVEVLGDYLPLEQKERDLIDKISSRIHF